MAKYSRTRVKELMLEEINQNPDVRKSQKRILVMLSAWITIRFLLQIVEIVCVSQGFMQFSGSNAGGLFVMFIFAYGVYSGEKPCAILPIIGGAVMLVQYFMYDYLYVMLSYEYYYIVRIYSLIFLVASALQVGIFLYITLSEKTNVLFDAYKCAVEMAKAEKESDQLK